MNIDEILTAARAAGVPVGLINHFANDRLLHHIDTADCDGCPGAQHGAFCNAQDRRYDLGVGATEMETQPHMPAAWTTTGRRMVGFWGSADLVGFHVVPPFVDAPLTIVRD
jgi:hypothetical protein